VNGTLTSSMTTILPGYRPARRVLFYMIFFSLIMSPAGAASFSDRPPDDFQDPREDPHNPLKYIMSNTLTAIAFGKPRSARGSGSRLIYPLTSGGDDDRTHSNFVHLPLRCKVDVSDGHRGV
jgi:hypothetical protein